MDRKEKIYKLLLNATENSFTELFEKYNEQFYYCSLVMMDCSTPCISALSMKAYQQLLEDNADGNNSSEEDKIYFKWCYAESPFLGFGYKEYFKEVDEFFFRDVLSEIPYEEVEMRINDWLISMRDVMKTLKDKGIFENVSNSKIFLTAEQHPSETDYNLENAKYINDNAVFEIWYKDNRDLY